MWVLRRKLTCLSEILLVSRLTSFKVIASYDKMFQTVSWTNLLLDIFCFCCLCYFLTYFINCSITVATTKVEPITRAKYALS